MGIGIGIGIGICIGIGIGIGMKLTHAYMANPRTKILDSRGFDSSIILFSRGGMFMPIGDFLEMLSQAILVGIILVGREAVYGACERILLDGASRRSATDLLSESLLGHFVTALLLIPALAEVHPASSA